MCCGDCNWLVMSWPKTSTLLLLYGPAWNNTSPWSVNYITVWPALKRIPSCSWALLLCQAGGRKPFSRAVGIIVGGQGAMDWKRGGQGTWCQVGSSHDEYKVAMPKISLTCDSQIHSHLLWYVFIVRKAQNRFPPLGPYPVVIIRTWKEGKKKEMCFSEKGSAFLSLLKLDISDALYFTGFIVSLSQCHALCCPWSHLSFHIFHLYIL